jgi:hypothetical protein
MKNLVVIRGDSETLILILNDDAGSPLDLTDADVRFTVEGLLTKNLGDGIVVDDPLTGTGTITIEAGDTASAPGRRTAYPYDVQVTLADATVKTPLRGLFVVLPDVTR